MKVFRFLSKANIWEDFLEEGNSYTILALLEPLKSVLLKKYP